MFIYFRVGERKKERERKREIERKREGKRGDEVTGKRQRQFVFSGIEPHGEAVCCTFLWKKKGEDVAEYEEGPVDGSC